MGVVFIVLIAYAIGEFLRESEQLEREWHTLGEPVAQSDRAGRWTDFNL
jgi:hypothetical protein